MKIFSFLYVLFLVLSLEVLGCSNALADEAAGVVMLASGKLEASQNNQSPRLLKRGSSFFKNDTLTTYDGSEAQLRFTDGTLVSLRPHSVFRIDQYQFSNTASSGSDNYAVSLIKGGFRSISGEIAKRDPNEYKIKTDTAVIGVRGTEFSLMLDTSGGLGAATYKGRIYLRNSAGYIEIGDGAEYNYAYVASSKSKPQGEPIRPVFMLNDPRIINTIDLHRSGNGHNRDSFCLQ